MSIHHHHIHRVEEFKRRFWLSLALTIPILLLSDMIRMWLGLHWIVTPFQRGLLSILSIAIYIYGGWPFLEGLIREVRSRQPGMMALIGTAISVALFYSVGVVIMANGGDFFWELATLIDVMLLGHWMEAKSILGASTAIEDLIRIMPAIAHLVRDEGVVDIPASRLRRGDIVLVRPGERIPSDGVIVEGRSTLDESLLTGESKPIDKGVGDTVIGGTINGEGTLKIRIECTSEETYLAQVIRLVREVQKSKSRTQDLANRAAALLFYVALTVGMASFIIWSFIADLDFAIERMVTVLVIACPHALGLAIPLVVALSTSIAARNGILIRDRRAIEVLKDVDIVIFDKTGTLTVGELTVSDIISFIPEEDLLRFTASIEVNSEHVIAKAIVRYARSRGVEAHKAVEFKALPGKGVYGRVMGRDVYVGGLNLLEDLGIRVDDLRVAKLQEQGKTIVFTVIDGKLAGIFALSDSIRVESYEAVKILRGRGLKVYMLTGDSEGVARLVAEELGIDAYFARVSPDQKVEKIKLLRGGGGKVAMIGDGVNDAPALIAADVGIAIGAGTDIAIESADIILVKNDPRDVVKAIDICRRTYSKMVQNIWWAAGYNIVAIPLAAGALSWLGLSLPPAIGALIMSLSDIIVVLNSQTLRRYEPKVMGATAKKIMIKDPVCGMMIDPDTAYSRIEYEGRTIYFCSKVCEEEFKRDPKRFMK
jgi:Cu2+-exporting ATPase